MGGLIRLDKQYKRLPIFVLDPIEYTAMGLKILSGMDGEKKWDACQKAKWDHPDPQKTACIANGAIIYTALYPDRTHRDHRPPEAWRHEAGITENGLADARRQLELEDPQFMAKRVMREEVAKAMDEMELTIKDKQ